MYDNEIFNTRSRILLEQSHLRSKHDSTQSLQLEAIKPDGEDSLLEISEGTLTS